MQYYYSLLGFLFWELEVGGIEEFLTIHITYPLFTNVPQECDEKQDQPGME